MSCIKKGPGVSALRAVAKLIAADALAACGVLFLAYVPRRAMMNDRGGIAVFYFIVVMAVALLGQVEAWRKFVWYLCVASVWSALSLAVYAVLLVVFQPLLRYCVADRGAKLAAAVSRSP